MDRVNVMEDKSCEKALIVSVCGVMYLAYSPEVWKGRRLKVLDCSLLSYAAPRLVPVQLQL